MKTPYYLLTTEQVNERTKDIDRCDTLGILQAINDEDQLVPIAVGKELPNIAAAVDRIVPLLQAGGRLFYIGAGTSGRIGILDASECPPTYGTDTERVQALNAGGDTAIRIAVEGAEDSEVQGRLTVREHNIKRGDAVVGITASGTTPFVVAALREAGSAGALTVALTNNRSSELSRISEIAITPIVGPESVTGSTRMKAGTSQKLVLNMITTGTMIKLGKVFGNLMVDLQASNHKLCDRMIRIVMQAASVSEEKARTALVKSGLRPKIAIIMLLGGVDCACAERLLSGHEGFVSKALEDIYKPCAKDSLPPF